MKSVVSIKKSDMPQNELDYLVLVNSDIKAASRCSGSWSDMQSARL
jgi:hypothetical protein